MPRSHRCVRRGPLQDQLMKHQLANSAAHFLFMRHRVASGCPRFLKPPFPPVAPFALLAESMPLQDCKGMMVGVCQQQLSELQADEVRREIPVSTGQGPQSIRPGHEIFYLRQLTCSIPAWDVCGFLMYPRKDTDIFWLVGIKAVWIFQGRLCCRDWGRYFFANTYVGAVEGTLCLDRADETFCVKSAGVSTLFSSEFFWHAGAWGLQGLLATPGNRWPRRCN